MCLIEQTNSFVVFAAVFKEHDDSTFRRFGSLIDSPSIALFDFSRHQSILCLEIEYNARPVQQQEFDLCKNLDVLDSTDAF
jgi:hypothetical protein